MRAGYPPFKDTYSSLSDTQTDLLVGWTLLQDNIQHGFKFGQLVAFPTHATGFRRITMSTYHTLKALALAGLACFPSLIYGHKDAVKLFPRRETHGALLVPYFTPRSLVKRNQALVGEIVNSIALPELGQSVELLYGEGIYY